MSTKHVNRFFPISSFSSSWEALDQSDCYFPSLSCRRKRRTRTTKNCRCHCCCCRCRPRRRRTRSCLSHCCRMSRRQSCLSHCCWSPRTWEHMPRRAPRNTRLWGLCRLQWGKCVVHKLDVAWPGLKIKDAALYSDSTWDTKIGCLGQWHRYKLYAMSHERWHPKSILETHAKVQGRPE